jgi:hypothetical protein
MSRQKFMKSNERKIRASKRIQPTALPRRLLLPVSLLGVSIQFRTPLHRRRLMRGRLILPILVHAGAAEMACYSHVLMPFHSTQISPSGRHSETTSAV